VTKRALDLQDMFLQTNRFVINFDKVQDPTDKRLILGAAMLLDLEYFEVNKNNNN